MSAEHVHNFRPRPSGQRYGYTDWVDGKPVHRTEPIQEMVCDCGLRVKDFLPSEEST